MALHALAVASGMLLTTVACISAGIHVWCLCCLSVLWRGSTTSLQTWHVRCELGRIQTIRFSHNMYVTWWQDMTTICTVTNWEKGTSAYFVWCSLFLHQNDPKYSCWCSWLLFGCCVGNAPHHCCLHFRRNPRLVPLVFDCPVTWVNHKSPNMTCSLWTWPYSLPFFMFVRPLFSICFNVRTQKHTVMYFYTI